MPYINYCRSCGTPIRYSGRQWVHYRDHDHTPVPVSVRMRAPIDSINEAVKRDEPSITNIVSRANTYIDSGGAYVVWCDLFDLLLTDKDKTVEFMLDLSVEERYKTECLMVLAGTAHWARSEVVELWRELWKSDKLPDSVRATLKWLNDVRMFAFESEEWIKEHE